MKQIERVGWIVVVIGISAWSYFGKTGGGVNSPEPGPAFPHTTRARERGSETKGATSRHLPRTQGAKKDNLAARSRQALRSGDSLSRLAEILKILGAADAGDLAQVQAAFADLKSAGLSFPAEEELLQYRAGQIKGAELLSGRRGSSEDFAMMGTLKKQYEGWIQADPQAANVWLDNLPAGKFRDQMAVAYIAASTNDDPVSAYKLVSSLHPSQQEHAAKAVGERLAKSTSADEASTVLRNLESKGGGTDTRNLSSMFETLVTEPGKGGFAIAMVEKNLDESYVSGSTLARVSEVNAKTDPEATLMWAVSMEGKKVDVPEGEVVSAAIRGMTVDGLEAAKAWAATQQEGADYWLNMIEQRQELLLDRIGEENEYDKDD